MNASEVLIDLLQDNLRRLHRVLEAMQEECLRWRPDPGGNSIEVTVWHIGRLFDVFLTQLVEGKDAAHEVWFTQGWAELTGYDPRGIGREGWGSVNDYSQAEVAAIPKLNREQLLGYCDQVAERVTAYLRVTPIEALLQTGPGLGARFSKYQLIQMALLDNVRHLGEVLTLKALWERTARPASEAAS
jgi:DinB superfamily